MEGKGYFGPDEMPVFDRSFFDFPRGDATEWAFSKFKDKAVAAGGAVTDDLPAESKEELGDAIRRQSDDIEPMGDQSVS